MLRESVHCRESSVGEYEVTVEYQVLSVTFLKFRGWSVGYQAPLVKSQRRSVGYSAPTVKFQRQSVEYRTPSVKLRR